jgi:hypothetical protein
MTYAERADRSDADLSAAAAAQDSDRALMALLSRPRLDERERVLIIAALGESRTAATRALGQTRQPPQIKTKTGRAADTHTSPATRLEALWPGLQPDGPPAAAIDLPRLHTPTAWWPPGYQPPPRHPTVLRCQAACCLGVLGRWAQAVVSL